MFLMTRAFILPLLCVNPLANIRAFIPINALFEEIFSLFLVTRTTRARFTPRTRAILLYFTFRSMKPYFDLVGDGIETIFRVGDRGR